MEIDDDTYILGYWFASDGENNWYLMMTKKDGKWRGEYTFRYNKDDDDPFLNKDEKSTYYINPNDDWKEERVINEIDGMFEFIKNKFNDYSDKFLVQGDIKKFMEIAKTKHYLHMKQIQ